VACRSRPGPTARRPRSLRRVPVALCHTLGVVTGIAVTLGERPFPEAKREYDAVELTFDKRFSDNWSLFTTYTYSKLWGNYSGLANSDEQNSFGSGSRNSPNVSRLFDTVSSMYDRNGEAVYGRLATDRPHQLKANFRYYFDFGMSVGVNQYIGSGTPVSEIAYVPISTEFYPYGRGNLGRTPTLTQTDLTLSQSFEISNLDFEVALTVLNLFDEDTVTRRWGHRTLQDLQISEEEFFAGGWDYEEEVGKVDPDPAYEFADNYQAAREVRLMLKMSF